MADLRAILSGLSRRLSLEADEETRQRFWRRRVRRWIKTGAAFVLTLSVIAAAYLLFVATQGRVAANVDAPLPAAPENGAVSIAAAAELLSLPKDALRSGALFLPNRYERRASLFQEGAADAVAGFVETVARRRARDRDLDAAATLLAAPLIEAPEPADRYASAREALRRYNARATAAKPAVDLSRPALAAAARAAAAACEAHERAVRAAAVAGRFGPAGPDAEAAFFRARGEAFGWARLLSAYEQDLSVKLSEPLHAALDEARRPLVESAEFEPRVLFNAKPGGIAPNHLERMATDLAAAVAAARRLDEVASK
ncbi:MAG: hypothetical protein WDN76_04145 [Alphaproteobacteria bacterium]